MLLSQKYNSYWILSVVPNTQFLVWVAILVVIGILMFPPKPVNTSFPVLSEFPLTLTFVIIGKYLNNASNPNLWWQNHWLCSWSFPFKVQSSNVLHTHRGVTLSLKLNLFDPDGHRKILIYRKQHTVPFITVAHLRVILTLSYDQMCWIFLNL